MGKHVVKETQGDLEARKINYGRIDYGENKMKMMAQSLIRECEKM